MKGTYMRMLVAIATLFIQGLYLTAQAEQAIELVFEKANTAFSKKDYKTAITGYKEISSRSGQSAAVLFNLGNSYARNDQIGMAVLNYERALRISPSDSDIIGNIQLLKKETGLFVNEYKGVERILFSLSLSQWTILFLAILVMLASFHIISLLHPIRGKSVIAFSVFCCIMLCFSIFGGYASYQRYNPSIVISSGARILISPFESANSVGTIQEGRRVYPAKTYKVYTYVTDETGRKGWIANASIEAVYQPAKT